MAPIILTLPSQPGTALLPTTTASRTSSRWSGKTSSRSAWRNIASRCVMHPFSPPSPRHHTQWPINSPFGGEGEQRWTMMPFLAPTRMGRRETERAFPQDQSCHLARYLCTTSLGQALTPDTPSLQVPFPGISHRPIPTCAYTSPTRGLRVCSFLNQIPPQQRPQQERRARDRNHTPAIPYTPVPDTDTSRPSRRQEAHSTSLGTCFGNSSRNGWASIGRTARV